jgi:hypothetical protein
MRECPGGIVYFGSSELTFRALIPEGKSNKEAVW